MEAPTVEHGEKTAQQQKGSSQPKALRFVTNYGAPHPKRRRIGAACLTCRKRKTACSGDRPFCETCKQNRLQCAGYSTESTTPSHKRTSSDAGRRHSDAIDDQSGSQLSWVPPQAFQREKAKVEDVELLHKVPSNSRRASAGTRRDDNSTDATRGRERDQESLFSGPRNRMPYFRWLGPTAIMPGFKQMVVKVKRQDTDLARSSTDGAGGMVSPSLNTLSNTDQRGPSGFSNTPAAVESDVRTPLSLPFYDTSPMPPSELITHLANTFFTHLGCNYPFLQKERFMRDLDEKQVDAILVDAVCALAARFSTHPLLAQQPQDDAKPNPAEYGHAFAQRAKTALVDTFPCPSVAAVQAALLLAYNEFGESRDSGLWMYLGISIRMAQDLGMHKLEGLKYRGKDGPTPKMVKQGESTEQNTAVKPSREGSRAGLDINDYQDDEKATEEQKAVEQERVDTFWAVFFLDRVVSSGTGRRSTLRDKDIEISFPSLEEALDSKSGESPAKSSWPAPFPALIRIVHLYGRVADLLNSIKEPSDINAETPRRLAAMESQVTNFYQNLSPRLHFDAMNFQHYMKAGEGTNFVLLHFWFHLLIVLLHQPTLLKTFEGHMLQLFPNSQQLSMSSAKTIADILAYSQLMDAKASLGNPFTTQPIYIAACAFLKETAEQTASSNSHSRANSPGRKDTLSDSGPSIHGSPETAKKPSTDNTTNGKPESVSAAEQKALAKHTLLATAASQHYQLCYKALQSLETYWAGTKYILTVLDQKFEGVCDPLLYTVEEGESSMERPMPEPSFTSPGWRRKLSWHPYLGTAEKFLKEQGLGQVPGSPNVDPTKAIGWTLTGNMNSSSTNLAWHYPSAVDGAEPGQTHASLNAVVSPTFKPPSARMNGQYVQHNRAASLDSHARPSIPRHPSLTSQASNAEAGLLLGLGSSTSYLSHAALPYPLPSTEAGVPQLNGNFSFGFDTFSGGHASMQDFGDLMIQSQDVDMSTLGLDMMPWFDSYPTHDMLSMFDPGGDGTGGQAGGGAQQQNSRHTG